MSESTSNPINGLGYAPEWSGTNIYLVSKEIRDYTQQLFPDEKEQTEHMAEPRLKTFSTGRHCARAALQAAGLPAVGLPRKDDGSIAWPEGVVGSLSHTNDWAVAGIAVTAMSDVASLGVDLERIQALEDGVLNLIATPEERAELSASGNEPWQATALFGLKESIYKCLRPSFGSFFEFHDVQIKALSSGRPSVHFNSQALSDHCKPSELVLRMAVSAAHVFTLVWRKPSLM